MLLNLCINARDAMPDGGKITLTLTNFTPDEAFCQANPWAQPRAYARVDVTDTGMGVAPEVQHRIFEPFVTTKEVGKGTGLGLSVAYGILKQHDGHIGFESEPGQGTTFSLFLPVSESSAQELDDAVEQVPRGDGETILVAEDEERVRLLLVKLLADNGYHVLPVVDGKEALRIIEENPDSIDLAIFDVVMPGMGGKAAYLRARLAQPALPVLFCTGYDVGMIDEIILSDNLVSLIQKPFEANSLFRAVQEALLSARSS